MSFIFNWTFSFNGAVDLNPRKRAGRVRPAAQPGRFNGAVDLNPRKLGVLSEVDTTDGSFNGAVDLNPRKRGGRGLGRRRSPSLQWGRGFESTETSASSKNRRS